MLTAGIAANYVTAHFGVNAVRRIRVRWKDQAWPGDALTYRGFRLRRDLAAAGTAGADVEVQVTRPDGQSHLLAWVDLADEADAELSEERLGVGPLTSLRVIEMAGLGPVPHAAMQLADMGADVIRVARPGPRAMIELAGVMDHVLRGRTSVVADLKSDDDKDDVLALVAAADVLVEGSGPGLWNASGSARTSAPDETRGWSTPG